MTRRLFSGATLILLLPIKKLKKFKAAGQRKNNPRASKQAIREYDLSVRFGLISILNKFGLDTPENVALIFSVPIYSLMFGELEKHCIRPAKISPVFSSNRFLETFTSREGFEYRPFTPLGECLLSSEERVAKALWMFNERKCPTCMCSIKMDDLLCMLRGNGLDNYVKVGVEEDHEFHELVIKEKDVNPQIMMVIDDGRGGY